MESAAVRGLDASDASGSSSLSVASAWMTGLPSTWSFWSEWIEGKNGELIWILVLQSGNTHIWTFAMFGCCHGAHLWSCQSWWISTCRKKKVALRTPPQLWGLVNEIKWMRVPYEVSTASVLKAVSACFCHVRSTMCFMPKKFVVERLI